jgi:hypothetical protein
MALILPASLVAQTYLWPTNASKYLASSFCEYRSGHYHAAIDIKTWNQEGYPCYAVEDGKIHRIKLSSHGAGKALYLKLKDGRFAVYFHLQKFPDPIEKELLKLQLEQKKYGVEWWPKDWYVKKGEIVAYTGQTGIGVPHLHFEIRSAGNVPVNPIPFFNDVKDTIRPQLKKLLIIPQDKFSSINNSFMPSAYDLTYIRDGVYVIEQPLYGEGLLGLAINGFDQANDVNNKLGFYSTKMFVDGGKVFEYAYDKISFSQTRFVDIDIYHPEKAKSGSRYNKLFLEDFNRLDFYNRDLGSGLIDVKNQKVFFETEVRDFFGNISVLKGTILPYAQHPAKPQKVSVYEGTAVIKLFLPDNISSIEIFGNAQKTEAHKIKYFEIIERTPMDGGTQAVIKIRLPDIDLQEIFSTVENGEGNQFNSQVKISPVIPQKQIIESTLSGRNVLFSFPGLKNFQNPQVTVFQNGPQDFNINPHSELILNENEIISDSLKLVVKNFDTVFADSTFYIYKMVPGYTQSFSFFNGNVLISTSTESAYDKLLFRIEQEQLDKELFSAPYSGYAVHLDGGGHILNRSMTLSLKPDSNITQLEKASIYRLLGDKVEYEGGSYNQQSRSISANIKTFNSYLIMADTVAPLIEIISPQKSEYTSLPPITFKTTDDLSGIGNEENIGIYFNNQYIVAEWDPEKDLVTGVLHFKPQQGDHTIKIVVKDRVANISEKIIPVRIK